MLARAFRFEMRVLEVQHRRLKAVFGSKQSQKFRLFCKIRRPHGRWLWTPEISILLSKFAKKIRVMGPRWILNCTQVFAVCRVSSFGGSGVWQKSTCENCVLVRVSRRIFGGLVAKKHVWKLSTLHPDPLWKSSHFDSKMTNFKKGVSVQTAKLFGEKWHFSRCAKRETAKFWTEILD